MNAPDTRPTATVGAAVPMETEPEHQLEHQMPELEPLAKVLPAGGPLITTWWTCARCGYAQRGGPPSHCMYNANPTDCPLGKPAL